MIIIIIVFINYTYSFIFPLPLLYFDDILFIIKISALFLQLLNQNVGSYSKKLHLFRFIYSFYVLEQKLDALMLHVLLGASSD